MLDSMDHEMLRQTFDTQLTHTKLLLGRSPAFSLSKVVKVEPSTGFVLPPTPPSCSSSEESEDNTPCSQPSSPSRSRTNTRVLLSSHTTTRQPIHTPLISSQPVSPKIFKLFFWLLKVYFFVFLEGINGDVSINGRRKTHFDS